MDHCPSLMSLNCKSHDFFLLINFFKSNQCSLIFSTENELSSVQSIKSAIHLRAPVFEIVVIEQRWVEKLGQTSVLPKPQWFKINVFFHQIWSCATASWVDHLTGHWFFHSKIIMNSAYLISFLIEAKSHWIFFNLTLDIIRGYQVSFSVKTHENQRLLTA